MVSLYDTLGKDSISYIINHSGITTCFCCDSSLKKLIEVPNLGGLKNIVYFDPVSNDDKLKLENKGLKLFDYNEVMNCGHIESLK